jgi:hypothetical protein
LFQDEAVFRERLAKQLEDQAPFEMKRKKGDKSRKETQGEKPEKEKKSKKKTHKGPDSVVHFDRTAEEMLQIVCSGRFRPKNYSNFILPKEKYVLPSLITSFSLYV